MHEEELCDYNKLYDREKIIKWLLHILWKEEMRNADNGKLTSDKIYREIAEVIRKTFKKRDFVWFLCKR